MDSEAFYATTAQVLPALLIAFMIEISTRLRDIALDVREVKRREAELWREIYAKGGHDDPDMAIHFSTSNQTSSKGFFRRLARSAQRINRHESPDPETWSAPIVGMLGVTDTEDVASLQRSEGQLKLEYWTAEQLRQRFAVTVRVAIAFAPLFLAGEVCSLIPLFADVPAESRAIYGVICLASVLGGSLAVAIMPVARMLWYRPEHVFRQ